MVKDFKGYREKTDEKPRSAGWTILVISHMAIFVLGISLGYWISGRFAKDSVLQKTVSQEVESRKERPSESIAQKEEGVSDQALGTDEFEKQSLMPQDQPEKKPRFTFYESLPKQIIPGTETPVEPKGTKKGRPSTETRLKSSGIKTGSTRSTQEQPSVIYYVQVASFREENRAKTFRDQLRERGYPVEVAAAVVKDKGIWYRVRWGPFGDKAQANKKLRAIAEAENLRPVISSEKTEKSQ